jgi:hypothetical protein
MRLRSHTRLSPVFWAMLEFLYQSNGSNINNEKCLEDEKYRGQCGVSTSLQPHNSVGCGIYPLHLRNWLPMSHSNDRGMKKVVEKN